MSRKPEKLGHWCIVFKDSNRHLDEKERWKVGQEGDGETARAAMESSLDSGIRTFCHYSGLHVNCRSDPHSRLLRKSGEFSVQVLERCLPPGRA